MCVLTVGVMGRSCGVMRRRSGMRVVTPVIIADHSSHSGTRRRLQRSRRFVPRPSVRLAGHVHRVQRDFGASRSLAKERAGEVTAGRGDVRRGRRERDGKRNTERERATGREGRLGILPKAPLFLFRRPRDAQWDHR